MNTKEMEANFENYLNENLFQQLDEFDCFIIMRGNQNRETGEFEQLEKTEDGRTAYTFRYDNSKVAHKEGKPRQVFSINCYV